MSAKRTVRAVEVKLATHKAIAAYARRQGIGISEAADALVTTGLARAEALERDKQKRRKKTPPRAVVEAASDEERKEHAHAVAEAPPS